MTTTEEEPEGRSIADIHDDIKAIQPLMDAPLPVPIELSESVKNEVLINMEIFGTAFVMFSRDGRGEIRSHALHPGNVLIKK